MADSVNIPSLLRQARVAVSNQAYAEAEALYVEIMSYKEMQNSLDLKMRHAFCAEKIGKIDVAVKYYQEIVISYHELGELAAAEVLEKQIADLYVAAETELSKTEAAEQIFDAKQLDVKQLDEKELLPELAKMGEKRSLYPTEVLSDTEEVSEHLWLIEHGMIDVFMPSSSENKRIEPAKGSLVMVGELGLFTGQRRNSTLVAHTTVDYYAVEIEKIRQRQRREPLFNACMLQLLQKHWVEPILKQHSMFERLNDSGLKLLARMFEPKTLNAGETLLAVDDEHDGAYILQRGCMFLMYDEDDEKNETIEEEYMMTGIHPGDLLHLSGLLRGHKSAYSIVAATPVELMFISRQSFETFIQNRPWIVQALIRYSRRPGHLQVLHPQDEYLWQGNKDIRLRKAYESRKFKH